MGVEKFINYLHGRQTWTYGRFRNSVGRGRGREHVVLWKQIRTIRCPAHERKAKTVFLDDDTPNAYLLNTTSCYWDKKRQKPTTFVRNSVRITIAFELLKILNRTVMIFVHFKSTFSTGIDDLLRDWPTDDGCMCPTLIHSKIPKIDERLPIL